MNESQINIVLVSMITIFFNKTYIIYTHHIKSQFKLTVLKMNIWFNLLKKRNNNYFS